MVREWRRSGDVYDTLSTLKIKEDFVEKRRGSVFSPAVRSLCCQKRRGTD